jgi:hypothetical protein
MQDESTLGGARASYAKGLRISTESIS